jgi:hypothetical protein
MKKRQDNYISASKRAEIPSTVFVYAMTAVIVSLILLFGYKAIGKLTQTTCATELATFKTDLDRNIVSYTGYGKNILVKMKAPCGYEELCFVSGNLEEDNLILEKYPQAVDISESSDNVFLADSEGSISSFKVDSFEIDESSDYGKDAFCVRQKSGDLKFRIEGQGDIAIIIPAEI